KDVASSENQHGGRRERTSPPARGRAVNYATENQNNQRQHYHCRCSPLLEPNPISFSHFKSPSKKTTARWWSGSLEPFRRTAQRIHTCALLYSAASPTVGWKA